jgi:hypothetical protein
MKYHQNQNGTVIQSPGVKQQIKFPPSGRVKRYREQKEAGSLQITQVEKKSRYT